MTKVEKQLDRIIVAANGNNEVIKEVEKLKKLLSWQKSMEIRTSLEARNNDVLREISGGATYKEAAKKLGISVDQVGEAVKVLHDKKLLPYKIKRKAVYIDESVEDVQKLMKKCLSKSEIAKELGISDQTVLRCITRIAAKNAK